MLVKQERIKLGLSQTELAKKLNVSQQAVNKWELGKTNPRAEIIPQLAAALQCSVGDLFQQPDEKGAAANAER